MKAPSSNEQPTFERWAGAGAAVAARTYSQRGEQYADSWNETLDEATFETLGGLLSADNRIYRLGTLCDVKLARLRSMAEYGGEIAVIKDNLIDFIAYLQAMLGGAQETS